MKYIYLLALSVFLVSCGQVNQPVDQSVSSDIDSALETLSEENFETEWEVVQLDAFYSNPATEVDMVVSYSLDENGLITYIEANATATPNQIDTMNRWLATLIGKSLEEAKTLQVAGASLASEAFRKAIK